MAFPSKKLLTLFTGLFSIDIEFIGHLKSEQNKPILMEILIMEFDSSEYLEFPQFGYVFVCFIILLSGHILYDETILLMQQTENSEHTFDANGYPMCLPNQALNLKQENLFDLTFGKYERMRTINIRALVVETEKGGEVKIFPVYGEPFIINFFYSALNAKYIDVTHAVRGHLDSLHNQVCVLNYGNRKYIKELHPNYEPINDEVL